MWQQPLQSFCEKGEKAACETRTKRYLCEGFSRKRLPRSQATPNDTPVTSKKKMGMIHSSRNFSGKKSEQLAKSMRIVADLGKGRRRLWRRVDKE